MGKVDCNLVPNKYRLQDGKTCCERCPAGKFVHRVCDLTKATECADCGPEVYTDTINHLPKCLPCTQCNAKGGKEVKACLAHENRQCECIHGFYCLDAKCQQCDLASPCPLGQGVKVKAAAARDTDCAPCESGTFSNVSDDTSPCKTHTSCKDQGRVLKMPGNDSADAICGPFESGCSWELPTGLWCGLVLTSLLMFLGLIFWRTKHKSRKTVFPSVPTNPVVSVGLPLVHLNPPDLSAPSPLMDIHCQESCDLPSHITAHCNCCALDHVGSGLHNTHPEPNSGPKPFNYEANPTNGRPGNLMEPSPPTNGRPGNLMERSRSIHSEPQEDEWRET